MLLFEIPTLYRDSNNKVISPQNNYWDGGSDFDQYALLDFIEYIGQNCRDIYIGSFHSYFGHHHITLLKTNSVFNEYRKEINNIFNKTGLLFILTEKKIIEQVDIFIPEVEKIIKTVDEVGTKELLEQAVVLFKQPNPIARNHAVEKIWDAFERLKTYYTDLDKKISAEKIINNMSKGQIALVNLFNEEFKTLTKIGNDFRIRHHETNKIDISEDSHYDYFFNRCMALISLAIKYLK